MDPIESLKSDLSYHLLDAPYDPQGHTSDHTAIRELATLVRDWGMFGAPTQGVRAKFRDLAPGFDFDQWAAPYVADGTYTEEMFEED